LAVAPRHPVPPAEGGPGAAVPGTGTGLIGLTERATLAGGRLTAGRDADGGFTLRAWLPWPAGQVTP
jgi:signal transduction histidine kinase